MDIQLLVRIREPNKCGNVRNDEIVNLHICCWPLSQHPQQPHLLIPSAQIISQNRQRTQKLDSTAKTLYCLGLHTQKPGLREVDLEPSPKRSSDKINMLEKGRKTRRKPIASYSLDFTYGSQHFER